MVIGDIKNIRKDNNLGHAANQKLHALPYRKLYVMLEYKLSLEGISFFKQNEPYSSQTSPLAPAVDKSHACKSNRVKRGLYADNDAVWNADCVGAFNIVRLFLKKHKKAVTPDPMAVQSPYILKVAV